jgi:hypothetical protein
MLSVGGETGENGHRLIFQHYRFFVRTFHNPRRNSCGGGRLPYTSLIKILSAANEQTRALGLNKVEEKSVRRL